MKRLIQVLGVRFSSRCLLGIHGALRSTSSTINREKKMEYTSLEFQDPYQLAFLEIRNGLSRVIPH